MELKAIPAAQLTVLLALAEDQWEHIKSSDAGRERRSVIKEALADGHLALQRPSL